MTLISTFETNFSPKWTLMNYYSTALDPIFLFRKRATYIIIREETLPLRIMEKKKQNQPKKYKQQQQLCTTSVKAIADVLSIA